MVKYIYVPTVAEVCKIGERLHYFRQVRGMTLHELSDLTGFSKSKIHQIEKRSPELDFYALLKFSNALDVSLDALCGSSQAAEVR